MSGQLGRRATRRDEDAGATLVLALVFMMGIGLLVGGMAAWTGNSLLNAANFKMARSEHYALNGATQTAIQSIRFSPLLGSGQSLNASPPYDCWEPSPVPTPPTQSQVTLDGYTVDVFCSTVWNPTSSSTRVVTVSACTTPTSAQACAAHPGLRSIVTFDDYTTGNPSVNPGVCTATCGAGMTINSSTTPENLPTVTGLSVSGGPDNANTTLTVTGTGFVSNGTWVNLVSTTASQNLVLVGTGVTVSSTTSLTVTAPPSTTATSFYVEVTTPSGTSAVVPGQSPTFTYQSVLPQISSVTGPGGSASGSAAGGSAVTILGTGFLDNAAGDTTTVNFIDVNNPANVVQSPYAKVSGYVSGVQTITAVTPAVASTDMTYYVTVTTTPGGTSAQSSAFEWTFEPLTPVVSGVGPATGGSGTTLTITGIGFVSGQTTVQLVPTQFGTTLNATNVAVQSSTQLTAVVPSGGQNNGSYYVEVTTTTGGSSGNNGSPVYTY